MAMLETLLRGVAAGAMLATGLGMLAGGRGTSARRTGALFCLSVAAFTLHTQGPETEALGILRGPDWLLSAGGTAWFWLFAVTLFEDRPFGWDRLVPAAVLTAVAAVAASLPREVARGVWVAHNLLEVGLVLHVLWVVWRSWGGDLVEARRSFRASFFALIAVYAMLLSAFEIAEYLGFRAEGASLAQAASLTLLALAGAVIFLQQRPGLFEPPARPAAPAAPDAIAPRDRPALAALQALMAGDEVWRREGLTIGQLAAEVGTPEHRLRRLINDGLGFRNFSAYLNARRIEAARAALADPARAAVPVTQLAFELGYASLGPFNRAFKEATGRTPTAWRAQALARAAGAPNSEGSR
jgi:AraC-like DNA-binding protein